MKKYLEIGKIVSVHGIKGEVRVDPWADSPDFLCSFKTFFFEGGKEKIEVISSRVQKNVVVLKIKGVDTPEQAAVLRGRVIFIDRDEVFLEDGEYFIQDLIGLEVLDSKSSVSYGKISDVSRTGANDVYHIDCGSGNICLIPAIPDVIADTDIKCGFMKINVLEGLFDED